MPNSDNAPVFNLLRVPWLPARRRSGSVEIIAPWQITDCIDDDPFTTFAWPRPDFNGAAQEFLIGLLSTAVTPTDEDEWDALWRHPPTPEILQDRFKGIAHAFNLDGPGPRFLQDHDPLKDGAEKEVAALLIDAPGAQTLQNNADLFVKRGHISVLSRAAAAMALFTLSAYAPSGGAGHRTSLRGGGPLTTLVIAGDTLWGRLWPNVETAEQINARVGNPDLPDDPEFIFPWLAPTHTSNPKEQGRSTSPSDTHPLQVYWAMPRRIRLNFEMAGENATAQKCDLTGIANSILVRSYRTKNYGIDYAEGFLHPLTPYYRQKPNGPQLPTHPQPGGVTYRHWPGLVIENRDKWRNPAQTIRHIYERHRPIGGGLCNDKLRVTAFGYDMDNMKARAWIEGEMPLLTVADADIRGALEDFIQHAVKAADTVARLTVLAIKSALYDRPKDAPGDYGFVGEHFWRETEAAFYEALHEAERLARDTSSNSDDPTRSARENWIKILKRAALRLLNDHAPLEGVEDRNMERHAKAVSFLHLALRGQGKSGHALFEKDLAIPAPKKSAPRKKKDAT